MDADYLKKNVMGALTEALTSMAIKVPEDEVDFLGKYLLRYAERKKITVNRKVELDVVESKLAEYNAKEIIRQKAVNDEEAKKIKVAKQFQSFVDSIYNEFKTKQNAMDSAVKFIQEHMDIPASYIAVKKSQGEVESLYYLSAGPGQEHVKGRVLTKVINDESEEVPAGQGISFDALKVPEPPADEEPQEEDGGEEKVPKPPLKPQPLIIDNTLREKRCKFFGIPKIGSFVAVPFSFLSIDHESGSKLNSSDGEGPQSYVLNPVNMQFIIAIDSIGKYRTFKVFLC
jgi:hypothetical protein